MRLQGGTTVQQHHAGCCGSRFCGSLGAFYTLLQLPIPSSAVHVRTDNSSTSVGLLIAMGCFGHAYTPTVFHNTGQLTVSGPLWCTLCIEL